MSIFSSSKASAESSKVGGLPEDYLRHCRRRGMDGPYDYSLIRKAVDIVVGAVHPRAVVVYGDSADGLSPFEDRVHMMVVIEGGDADVVYDDALIALAKAVIDGQITVITPDQWVEDSQYDYTGAFWADRTGYLAYEA